MKKILLSTLSFLCLANFSLAIEVNDELFKKYKKITEDANLIQAIEMLDKTTGKYSKEAILGKIYQIALLKLTLQI